MVVSLSIAGLHTHEAPGAWADGVRAAIGWVADTGFRAVQLDAASPEIRPRGLDRSARRDLAATIRRAGLGFSGLDLWIPASHFSELEHADRAHAALLASITLAADLTALVERTPAVVSVTLPPAYAGLVELGAHADTVGVIIEDFALPARTPEVVAQQAAQQAGDTDHHATGGDPVRTPPAVRPGYDTARAILRGDGPGKGFAAWSKQLATLRLNDADDTGRRMMAGGTLDVRTIGALHTTLTPTIPIITDLRGLENPARAAAAAMDELGVNGPGISGFGPRD